MNRPWYITERPAGDFAVQRVVNGHILRWGVYDTRAQAEQVLLVARNCKDTQKEAELCKR